MVGFPTETDQDFEDTFRLSSKSDIQMPLPLYRPERNACRGNGTNPASIKKQDNKLVQNNYRESVKNISD